jgi:preprotein translocase subunit SecF
MFEEGKEVVGRSSKQTLQWTVSTSSSALVSVTVIITGPSTGSSCNGALVIGTGTLDLIGVRSGL